MNPYTETLVREETSPPQLASQLQEQFIKLNSENKTKEDLEQIQQEIDRITKTILQHEPRQVFEILLKSSFELHEKNNQLQVSQQFPEFTVENPPTQEHSEYVALSIDLTTDFRAAFQAAVHIEKAIHN